MCVLVTMLYVCVGNYAVCVCWYGNYDGVCVLVTMLCVCVGIYAVCVCW